MLTPCCAVHALQPSTATASEHAASTPAAPEPLPVPPGWSSSPSCSAALPPPSAAAAAGRAHTDPSSSSTSSRNSSSSPAPAPAGAGGGAQPGQSGGVQAASGRDAVGHGLPAVSSPTPGSFDSFLSRWVWFWYPGSGVLVVACQLARSTHSSSLQFVILVWLLCACTLQRIIQVTHSNCSPAWKHTAGQQHAPPCHCNMLAGSTTRGT
jgi:hypothetical protein